MKLRMKLNVMLISRTGTYGHITVRELETVIHTLCSLKIWVLGIVSVCYLDKFYLAANRLPGKEIFMIYAF